jgi:CRP-like cAMP-binding protein
MQYQNHVLSSLSPADLGAIAPLLREVSFHVDQVVYQPGDEAQAVYFPSSGIVSVVTTMRDGRCVETATIGNESVVGTLSALAQSPVHSRYFVQVQGTAMKLAGSALRDLAARSPSLMKVLLTHVESDVAQAEQSVACNALHTATQRLARWLLMSQDRIGGTVIALTQEFLSIMVGVQRTTVTAAAQDLKKAGLIRYRRGRIDILDRAGLELASCECYLAARERRGTPVALVA